MSTPARPSALPRPGRMSLSASTSGLPTPSRRKSTTPGTPGATGGSGSKPSTPDPEMAMALQEAMRVRPPSSLSNVTSAGSLGMGRPSSGMSASSSQGRVMTGYNTPPQQQGQLSVSTRGMAAQPRTPVAPPRARTPSAMRPSTSLRQSLATPPASRSVSGYTPGRVSTARSGGNPQTPTHPRSESRQSMTSVRSKASEVPFEPKIGDPVKVIGMGMEGVLRYLGPIDGKVGEWAGVELDPGFAGQGKNDGSVSDKRYFECGELCGVFANPSRLAAPQARPARPASVASSIRSGRMTPSMSGRETPYSMSGRRTPAFIEEEGSDSPLTGYNVGRSDVPLGRSTRANVGTQLKAAAAANKVSAGSRASHLATMTAKQLQARQAAESALELSKGVLEGTNQQTPAISAISRSISSATTPRPSRVSVGGSGAMRTPSRAVSTAEIRAKYGRESIGGFSTPKAPTALARSGRTSAAGGRLNPSQSNDMMPPPPSPNKGRVVSGGKSEELIQAERTNAELLIRVKELEEEIDTGLLAANGAPTREQMERQKKETDQRIKELSIASEFASKEASQLRIQLEHTQAKLEANGQTESSLQVQLQELGAAKETLENTLAKAKRDLEIQKERADTEYEKSMELKRKEISKGEETINKQEQQIQHLQMRLRDMETTGNEMIQVYDSELSELRSKSFNQSEKIRELEDSLAAAHQAKQARADAGEEEGEAAKLDRHNAEAQIAHLQNRVDSLEEQLQEMQLDAQKADELARKMTEKVKENDRRLREELAASRDEIADLRQQASTARSRTAEMEGALKQSRIALDSARAEVEGLRADLADLDNMRAAQETHARVEEDRSTLRGRVQQLEEDIAAMEKEHDAKLSVAVEGSIAEFKTRCAYLEGSLAKMTEAHDEASAKIASSGSKQNGDESAVGYQIIIRDLNEEIARQTEATKKLQSENDDLRGEVDGMRTDLQLLEEMVEQNIIKQEKDLHEEESAGKPGTPDKRAALELDKAKSRLLELERQKTRLLEEHARELEALEALVEAKIYHEADLEAQIEELKAGQHHASHSTVTARLYNDDHDRHPPRPESSASMSGASTSSGMRCELCEGDHALEDCTIMNPGPDLLDDADSIDSPLGKRMSSSMMLGGERSKGRGADRIRCDDCGSADHRTTDCPTADEVF